MITKRNLQINTYNTDPLSYRGPANSTELNNILNSLKINSLNCILRTRKSDKILNDLKKSYVYMNEYMGAKVRDLESRSYSLIQNAASGLNTSIISFYDQNIINSGIINNLNVDALYGQLSLSEDYSWSKITRYTDQFGDEKPTPDVKIYVDDILRSTDNDAYNCLDNLSYTLWIENTTYEDHVIKLQLPKSIKPKINSIKLDFFPQYNCIIQNIEYYSIKGFWEEIMHYESDGRSIKLYFSPYDYGDQIKITLRPRSVSNPIIGIGNIDLYLINYINNGNATFKFPEIEKYILTSIDDLIVDYYIDNFVVLNQFSTNNPLKVFLIIDGDEYEIPHSVLARAEKLNFDVGTINQKEISIRFELTEVNLTTPVIKGAQLLYTR